MCTDKRQLILDAMQDLLAEEKGAACSVSDIARKAGIGKGSIYYYFESKEAIFDALIERTYARIIEHCRELIGMSGADALTKFKLLLHRYQSAVVDSSIDAYLHQPQNAAIHQKSLAKILLSLSPIIADIIRQGIGEGLFRCEHPQELAEIVLSAFCFLLDPGIFRWTPEQILKKLQAVADVLENTLMAPKGSFAFLYQMNT